MRPKGYWKDWYWNKGGRDKVQARRQRVEYKQHDLTFKHQKFD